MVGPATSAARCVLALQARERVLRHFDMIARCLDLPLEVLLCRFGALGNGLDGPFDGVEVHVVLRHFSALGLTPACWRRAAGRRLATRRGTLRQTAGDILVEHPRDQRLARDALLERLFSIASAAVAP